MKKINLIIIFMFIFSLMLNANVIEDEILRLINLERSKSSLPPIPNNERLHSIALYHSDKIMADTDGIYGGRFSGAGFKGQTNKTVSRNGWNYNGKFCKIGCNSSYR